MMGLDPLLGEAADLENQHANADATINAVDPHAITTPTAKLPHVTTIRHLLPALGQRLVRAQKGRTLVDAWDWDSHIWESLKENEDFCPLDVSGGLLVHAPMLLVLSRDPDLNRGTALENESNDTLVPPDDM